MTDMTNIDAAADQKRKEAYFTASQGQLIWQRFKKNKSALIGMGFDCPYSVGYICPLFDAL
jgi:hypothetical protein